MSNAKPTSPLLISSHKKLPSILLDLRGTPCPINFVRTKLKLSQMEPGSYLEVWLDAGEPIEQVPDSLRMEGYPIEMIEPKNDYFSLIIRCPIEK